MTVTGVYKSDAKKRQIKKAIKIQEKDSRKLINRHNSGAVITRLGLDFDYRHKKSNLLLFGCIEGR